MADYVLIRKSRNIISSILHVLLNILLGVGSIVLTFLTDSWIVGLVLVLVSKWRIFAVRPRYWGVNLLSSLVDLIVGVSFVLIAYCSGGVSSDNGWIWVHTILAVSYCAWLIFLKPRSSEIATEAQSIVAIFLGTTAACFLFASSNSILLTVSCFLIGFAAARHILVQSDDNNFGLLTYMCGLISAEVAWLASPWLIIYTFDLKHIGIAVPQLSIILSVLFFLSSRVYKAGLLEDGDNGKINFSEISTPVIFSAIIIFALLIWFSNPFFDY